MRYVDKFESVPSQGKYCCTDLPRHIEEAFVRLPLLRCGSATLSNRSQVMFLRDRLVRSNHNIVSLQFSWGQRAGLPVVHAGAECARLDVVFDLLLPVGHHGQRDDCIARSRRD